MQVSLKHLLSFALLWLTSLVASYAYAVQPTFHAAEPRVNAVHSYETPVQAASSPWGDPVSTPQIYDYESLPLFECAPDIRSASPHALCAYERISSFLAAKNAVPAGQKLLGYTGKLADHHVMPRQFEKFFKSRGIGIDDFTVSVDHNVTHLKAIHGTGNMGQMPGRWNQIWGDWIKANPNATSKEIFQQAGQMMDDFGIGHLKIHPYGKP